MFAERDKSDHNETIMFVVYQKQIFPRELLDKLSLENAAVSVYTTYPYNWSYTKMLMLHFIEIDLVVLIKKASIL